MDYGFGTKPLATGFCAGPPLRTKNVRKNGAPTSTSSTSFTALLFAGVGAGGTDSGARVPSDYTERTALRDVVEIGFVFSGIH